MEHIQRCLLNKGYNTEDADRLSKYLMKIDSRLVSALNEWLNSDRITDIVVEGFSSTSLMQKYHLEYPGVLLTLDWLYREPEKAKSAIEKGIR